MSVGVAQIVGHVANRLDTLIGSPSKLFVGEDAVDCEKVTCMCEGEFRTLLYLC
jgi:hypothetical protein